MPKRDPGFVTQAEYGRHRGVSRKTVTDWKQKGLLVLDAHGRVDIAMTDAALDERPATNRGGVTSARKGNSSASDRAAAPERRGKSRAPVPAQRDPVPEDLADDEFEDASVDLSEFGIELAGGWSLAEASRVKEIYLALKRRQDFLVAEKLLAPIEDIAQQVEAEYAIVRERLLGIPGKLGASLVGLDQAAIESALEEEISEALRELHEPGVDRSAGDGGAARHPTADSEAGT